MSEADPKRRFLILSGLGLIPILQACSDIDRLTTPTTPPATSAEPTAVSRQPELAIPERPGDLKLFPGGMTFLENRIPNTPIVLSLNQVSPHSIYYSAKGVIALSKYLRSSDAQDPNLIRLNLYSTETSKGTVVGLGDSASSPIEIATTAILVNDVLTTTTTEERQTRDVEITRAWNQRIQQFIWSLCKIQELKRTQPNITEDQLSQEAEQAIIESANHPMAIWSELVSNQSFDSNPVIRRLQEEASR